MEISQITSSQNPKLKKFSTFNRRKTPELIMLDGAHLHTEYHKATGEYPETTLVSERFLASNDAAEFQVWPELIQVPDDLMARLSPSKSPAGILSLAQIPTINHSPSTINLTIILENIQDPGNLGSMLRTANAMGPSNVLLLGHCCDIWNDKCLRAGMGAQFYVSCQSLDDLAEWKKDFNGTLVSTQLDGKDLWQSPLPSPLALLFGNEGQGVSPQNAALCDQSVKIPMSDNAESLNVAASMAILTHEFRRQQG